MLTGTVNPTPRSSTRKARQGDAADGGMIKATQRHGILDRHDPAGSLIDQQPGGAITSDVTIRDDPSRRPGTLGTAVARLSPLLPGRAHPGGHRANLGGPVRPDSGCMDSSPNSKITWPGWRTRSSIPPPGPRTPPATWKTSTSPTVARPGHRTQAHRSRLRIRRRFGPASVYWLTQEYNAPARSLYDTLAHRTSFVVCTSAEPSMTSRGRLSRRSPARLDQAQRADRLWHGALTARRRLG